LFAQRGTELPIRRQQRGKIGKITGFSAGSEPFSWKNAIAQHKNSVIAE